jgi:hypothetical protein
MSPRNQDFMLNQNIGSIFTCTLDVVLERHMEGAIALARFYHFLNNW